MLSCSSVPTVYPHRASDPTDEGTRSRCPALQTPPPPEALRIPPFGMLTAASSRGLTHHGRSPVGGGVGLSVPSLEHGCVCLGTQAPSRSPQEPAGITACHPGNAEGFRACVSGTGAKGAPRALVAWEMTRVLGALHQEAGRARAFSISPSPYPPAWPPPTGRRTFPPTLRPQLACRRAARRSASCAPRPAAPPPTRSARVHAVVGPGSLLLPLP